MYGININNKGKTEKNKKVKEGDCIFPFTYKWKTHNKCFPTLKGEICATSIDSKSKRRTLKTYGYCKEKSTKKKTLKKKLKIKSISKIESKKESFIKR